MPQRRRRAIGAKKRLEILQRDNYTCRICGRSPITHPGLPLEVDHVMPFSKDGTEDGSNLQTLCRPCNAGKGSDEALNKAVDSELRNLLDQINPAINRAVLKDGRAVVVANSDEFTELARKNAYFNGYQIKVYPSTITGLQAGFSLGIYTLNDNGGSKTHFQIAPRSS
ncbi:MAG: HNH endonuclease [Acidimicrobiales bacterium]